MSEQVLAGFERRRLVLEGKPRDVYWAGQGPGVLVLAEVPGITPEVVAFARRVADAGFTAVVPHLFGDVGRPVSPLYALQTLGWACISREFTVFALRRSSPLTLWLRSLARVVHKECGGPGVGVVGMCLTGGFALAMMVDEAVLAPVLSQPSLPVPISPWHVRDLGISEAELARVKERCSDGVCVLGLRFSGDCISPAARFQRLHEELGDAFVAVEIDSSAGNPWRIEPSAHSVLTEDLVDEPGHPTRQALERVLALFRDRLAVTSA